MKLTPFLSLAGLLAVLSAPFAVAEDDFTPEPGYISLFNGKDLNGWYTFLQKHGKNSDPDHVITELARLASESRGARERPMRDKGPGVDRSPHQRP